MQDILSGMTKKSWKGVGLGPFKHDDYYDRYMFCQRLFERLKKYHSRGIEIINAPPGALYLAEHFPYYAEGRRLRRDVIDGVTYPSASGSPRIVYGH